MELINSQSYPKYTKKNFKLFFLPAEALKFATSYTCTRMRRQERHRAKVAPCPLTSLSAVQPHPNHQNVTNARELSASVILQAPTIAAVQRTNIWSICINPSQAVTATTAPSNHLLSTRLPFTHES